MKDLNSKDNSKVEAELDRAEKNGDIKWVKPLLHAYRDRPEDALRERMRTMLSTIIQIQSMSFSRIFMSTIV